MKIPTSIGFCPFFKSIPTLFCLELAVVDFVLGGKVSSNKAALVRFNESGLFSFSASDTCIKSLDEIPSFSWVMPLPLPTKEI